MERILFLTAAGLIAGLAAWYDWRKGEIPNWITLSALGAGLIGPSSIALGHGLAAFLQALLTTILGIVACGLAPLLLYRKSAIGGGDVKLLIGLGALLGPSLGLEVELYGFLLAALYAPARLAYEGKLLKTLANTVALTANPVLPKRLRRPLNPEMMTWLRLGPAVFAGFCVTALLEGRGP